MTDLVAEVRIQNAFLREQLLTKDELLYEQLRAKDEQLRVKDEQLRVKDELLYEQLRAKDEQLREQLWAKDEQLRMKNAFLREQLCAKDEQIRAMDEQIRAMDELLRQQACHFHTERIRMIDTFDRIVNVGEKVDNLLTSNLDVVDQHVIAKKTFDAKRSRMY